MTPNIRHLRAFVAVAEQGSFAKASLALHRAQSAITRSVQELERELDVRLFERRARGVLLTEFGRALLNRAERALAEMNVARDALAGAAARRAPIFALTIAERRLRVLVALTERGHMPSVAQAFGISQAAVSQSLREIEGGLGLRLFERSSRGLVPTAAAALLSTQIKRALAELRTTEADIAQLRGLMRGHVAVGALSLVRPQLLPAAIARLRERHPGLTVETVEAPFHDLAAALRAGELDFVLGALRPPDQTIGLVRDAIARDVMAVVVAADHPLARRRRLAIGELMGCEWVLPPRGTPTRELFERTLRRIRAGQPKVPVETADLSILRGLLMESGMLTAISPHQFHHEIRAGLLAVLPVPLSGTEREIGILRRADGALSPGAQALIGELREMGARLPSRVEPGSGDKRIR